jgi:outer membrane translocation and assembly module TamA
LPTSYGYSFLEEDLRLDLRDNPTRPRGGAYFGFNATEAPRMTTSDWTAFRVSPEARGYLPLPLDAVLASRFAIAALFVVDASSDVDDLSRRLGPTVYRLRGGGAYGNRGFLAGQLGAGIQGGLRRWESSLELRLPFGSDFGIVGFLDVGDVNDAESYRFSHLNTSAGFGFRYFTVIGALRLDAGFRIPAWQRADGSDGIEDDANDFPFTAAPGALHLTIGESF